MVLGHMFLEHNLGTLASNLTSRPNTSKKGQAILFHRPKRVVEPSKVSTFLGVISRSQIHRSSARSAASEAPILGVIRLDYDYPPVAWNGASGDWVLVADRTLQERSGASSNAEAVRCFNFWGDWCGMGTTF